MDDANGLTRRQLLHRIGAFGAGTLIYQAGAGLGLTSSLEAQTPEVQRGIGRNKHVVILGAGVAGLATAWELLRRGSGFRVTILEANPREGGRSLTLRPGDAFTERLPAGQTYRDAPGQSTATQRCEFEPRTATGFDRPYLNAGPGRIPSAHIHVLDYCRALNVPLEIYVMNSESNLGRGPGAPTFVYRHAANDAQGWIAERLYALVPEMADLSPEQKRAFQELLITFGALGNGAVGERGRFVKDGKYQRSTRSGYKRLPGVRPGDPVDPIPLADLLAAGYWKLPFYQPQDFLWQPTLFQPVGGMDRIVDALVKAIQGYRDRATIVRGAPVTRVRYDGASRTWQVFRSGTTTPVIADHCVSNIPIPLLAPLLEPGIPFAPPFIGSLREVAGTKDFLATTTKVGWQARRALWQKASEERVVPIFGGISWTGHPMTQLWYPSDRFHDELGVLTGAYNFAPNATTWGEYTPKWRLDRAREGARELAGNDFADGLGKGLAIAWQNMPFQRGGWAQWEKVQNRLVHYNTLLDGDRTVGFYIVGDQLSQLPGWQEGAVAAALNAVSLLAAPNFRPAAAAAVPDSRVIVEGLIPLRAE